MITHAQGNPSAADDIHLAAALASGAGAVLMRLRAEVDSGQRADAPAALRATADAASQAWLAAALSRARPSDAVLSEEAADDDRRLAAERVWIIDPLDGTREFAERTEDDSWRDDFAVHVALWVRGTGLAEGAVALPARGRVVDSRPAAAARQAAPEPVLESRRPLRLAVSRSRPPAIAGRLAEMATVELVPMGSCGVKALAVIDGSVDAYLHAGGQHEWDTAAPVAVARACGFLATRLDGSPLAFNQPRPWSPDLLICHPALGEHLRGLLTAAGDGGLVEGS